MLLDLVVMYFLLVVYLFLLILYRKSLTMVFLFGLQALSIICGFLAGYSIEIESALDIFYVLLILIGNIVIIIPWNNVEGNCIIYVNPQKADRVYTVLTFILIPVFVVLSVIAVLVNQFAGDNINEFKYNEDNVYFLYNALPFYARRLYQLSTLFYYFAYIILPFHFYYLQRGNSKKAIVCFILSLSIILYGFTYFSRSAIVHYTLLYIFTFLLIRKTIPNSLKTKFKIAFVILGVLMISYFISVSITRFENSTYYDNKISSTSITQDATSFGMIDYLGQATPNGFHVLQMFNGETMNGTIAIKRTSDVLQYALLRLVDNNQMASRRGKLLKEYEGAFLTVQAYNVYDFGILGSFFVPIVYFLFVKHRIRRRTTISNFCMLSFLSLYAALSIFYSTLDVIICVFMFFIPIYVYLNSGKSVRKSNQIHAHE